MTPLLAFFGPCAAVGLLLGAPFQTIIFRRKGIAAARRWWWTGGGLASGAILVLLWSGPLGGAARFIDKVERDTRAILDYYEVPAISGHLMRGPLSRVLLLDGRADDFQHSELARLLSQLPGVSDASWNAASSGVPMIVEAFVVMGGGYLVGAFFAYLVELHRRYNAQWPW